MTALNFFVMVSEDPGSNPGGSFRKTDIHSDDIAAFEQAHILCGVYHPSRFLRIHIQDIVDAWAV